LTHCHVIVIGAGIGGLTAALSLQRYGFKVSVYEQASELREFGAGILVTPNAMHALEFLGVGEVIAATSNVSNEPLMRHFQSGKIIHRRPDGHYYMSKYGAGHFQVHRADLHNALKAAVLANDSDCVHLAHTFNRLLLEMKGIAHSVFLEDCCTLPDQMPFVLTFPWRRFVLAMRDRHRSMAQISRQAF
jgi:2-polyprenyl-6-methoxyphenol hydroxylase-like FAD-dependent oxidoreductase